MERWALLQRTGPGKGRILVLKRPEYLIGRSSGATIRLTDSQASRTHARLKVTEKRLEIEDLGSANGTFRFGERITRAELGIGDAFSIGQCLFYVVRTTERLVARQEIGVWVIKGLLDIDPVSWRYRAQQRILDREVDLEILRENFTADSDLLQHYRHVLRGVAATSDPGIVPVFDLSEADNQFLVARRITALRPVQWEQLNPKERAELLAQFLEILLRWYERGITIPIALERLTLDPEGNPVLRLPSALDLYVVRKKLHTRYPQFLPYAAPEELLGESKSKREESYRLGVLLFRALLGAFPRQGKHREDFLKASRQPIQDPKSLLPALPTHLAELLTRLLTRRVDSRPSISECLRAWKAEGASRGVSRPDTKRRPPVRQAQKRFAQPARRQPPQAPSPLLRVAKAVGFILTQALLFLLSSEIVYWLLSKRVPF